MRLRKKKEKQKNGLINGNIDIDWNSVEVNANKTHIIAESDRWYVRIPITKELRKQIFMEQVKESIK